MTATTCPPEPYVSTTVCLIPPSSDVPQETVAPTTSAVIQEASSGPLPFTGGDVLGLSIIGSLAIAGGIAIVAANRRSRADG